MASSFRLPDEYYKNGLVYNASFNNELLSGINQGLSLYSKEQDTKLYRPLDTKPFK